jgi:two-component system, OmpR family, response regulator
MSTLEKVLYVEDEKKVQFITKFALERLGGFTVYAGNSGTEALTVAPDFMPDLALLDVRMPGMTGPETFVALRQLPGLEQLPAVFMTADVSPDDIAHYQSLGALGAISKPCEPEDLPDLLRDFWSQR